MRVLFFLCTIIAIACPAAAQTELDIDRGRQLTAWLYAAELDSILPVMSPEFLEGAGGRQGMIALTRNIASHFGTEVEVVEETVYREAGRVDYYRISRFAAAPQNTVTTRWIWRQSDGIVVGGVFTPTRQAAATEHADYVTRTSLRLPFDGKWYVAWGGREQHQNYHTISVDQRFAYDFKIVRDDATHSGDGTDNAQYYCFGQPVLAPAAGRVTSTVDSIADNTPGLMYYRQPAGNHVVIDHGNGEHSLLAHLRLGSVAVQPGQPVKAGDKVGECGNSGNSSEPHLHYHLQTGPAFREGVGLPAFFRNYRADGKPVDRGEPQRGETVERR